MSLVIYLNIATFEFRETAVERQSEDLINSCREEIISCDFELCNPLLSRSEGTLVLKTSIVKYDCIKKRHI